MRSVFPPTSIPPVAMPVIKNNPINSQITGVRGISTITTINKNSADDITGCPFTLSNRWPLKKEPTRYPIECVRKRKLIPLSVDPVCSASPGNVGPIIPVAKPIAM